MAAYYFNKRWLHSTSPSIRALLLPIVFDGCLVNGISASLILLCRCLRLARERNLLSEIKPEDDLEDKVKRVLGFFSRTLPPNLRMQIFSLRNAFFSGADYKDICSAWESFRARQDGKSTSRTSVSGRSGASNHLSRDNIGQDGKDTPPQIDVRDTCGIKLLFPR
jgi:hypothetical protein